MFKKNAAPPPLQKRTLMVKGRLTWQVMLLEDTGGLFFLRPHSLQDNTLTVKKGWHGKFCYLRSNCQIFHSPSPIQDHIPVVKAQTAPPSLRRAPIRTGMCQTDPFSKEAWAASF